MSFIIPFALSTATCALVHCSGELSLRQRRQNLEVSLDIMQNWALLAWLLVQYQVRTHLPGCLAPIHDDDDDDGDDIVMCEPLVDQDMDYVLREHVHGVTADSSCGLTVETTIDRVYTVHQVAANVPEVAAPQASVPQASVPEASVPEASSTLQPDIVDPIVKILARRVKRAKIKVQKPEPQLESEPRQ